MPATILCADDDLNLCQILARAFREEGYNVETAHDGERALELIRELKPDLVTLDVMLPRKDGFQVLEEVRGSKSPVRETQVILFSGCTFTPDYKERAQKLHADAVLMKPVPLETMLALAGKQIASRSFEVAAAAEPQVALEGCGSSELRGSLQEIQFPLLLHHLHGMRASGVLHLQNGKKKKQLEMREGHPVAVKSNLVNETLGNLLVASGTIGWDALHESLQRVKGGEGLQGQILMAMHMLDEDVLARALHNQAEQKLFEIFAWKKGSFTFKRGAELERANALTLKRTPASIIMDGVQLRLPTTAVDRAMIQWADRYPVPGESPFYRFQDIDLDDSAIALLDHLDGTMRVRDLEGLCEAERRTLYGLIAIEMLELRSEPAQPAPPAPVVAGVEPGFVPIAKVKLQRVARPEPRSDADEGVREELAAMAERFRGRDFFGVLGVVETVTDEEVRKAYTHLAKRTHPDRFVSSSNAVRSLAEEVFGLVSRAYDAIGDRDRRLTYLRDQRHQVRDAAELEEGHRALKAELEFQRGELALRGKQYSQAVSHFQRAVKAYPDEGEYHSYLGWSLYMEDPDAPARLEEAIETVRAGRKLAPDRQKPYLFLGRLYLADGRDRVAEKMFTRAVQLDPDDVEALRELRLMHMRREKKSKGLVKRVFRR